MTPLGGGIVNPVVMMSTAGMMTYHRPMYTPGLDNHMGIINSMKRDEFTCTIARIPDSGIWCNSSKDKISMYKTIIKY